ncbi:MAG TPA: TauD/TfdA family dioxygenase [Pyrinomonadaceae bacterium]|jgi:hypothetical protein|nr:TauD/TfdA family dioxygenase [Pyrinomonadaceae bacterium]
MNPESIPETGFKLFKEAKTETNELIAKAMVDCAVHLFKCYGESILPARTEVRMGDINIAKDSQVGAMGAGSKAENNTLIQSQAAGAESVDPTKLAEELAALLQAVKGKASTPEEFAAVGKIAEAQIAARKGETGKALEALSSAGVSALATAKEMEAPHAVKALSQSMPHIATELDRARVTPWTQLGMRAFLVEEERLGPDAFRRVWDNLERYGICLIRLHGYAPEQHVLERALTHIGFPAESQNDFTGAIKDITPEAQGRANSGDTTGELGFHVDGTQDPTQPAFLAFQYVEGAVLGAESRFADASGILAGFDDEVRNDILTNLARHDAATFSKLGESYTGPIFSFSPTGSLMCRIRFDAVIQVHDECREAFELLKERFENHQYSTMFLPNRGDIVVFDNHRVMHARDEIYGEVQRHHRRVWIAVPRREHQIDYKMGIRPITAELEAAIRKRNRGE